MAKAKRAEKQQQRGLQVREMALDDLVPYERNARTHSPEQVAAIARSIEAFGFNSPILIDSHRGIIAGHGRLLAAQQLKLKSIPVLELSHLSDAEKRAYIIADNQLALQAGWDYALLKDELEAISAEGIDASLIGFSVSELATIMQGWSADGDAINNLDETDAEGRSKITLECTASDKPDLIEFLRAALDASPFEHVVIA